MESIAFGAGNFAGEVKEFKTRIAATHKLLRWIYTVNTQFRPIVPFIDILGERRTKRA